jgi:cobalt-zinc-cadmium resistance protein CzcA
MYSLRCELRLHPHGSLNIHGCRSPKAYASGVIGGLVTSTLLTLLLLPVLYEWIFERERTTEVKR